MTYQIRKIQKQDFQRVLDLIKELAEFEKEPNAVEVTEDELQRDYELGLFDCYVVEEQKEVVGVALFYNRYSTWKGKTIHLEDLVVAQAHRGKGFGRLLLEAVIKEAKDAGVRRLEWCVLDWNEDAIKFYEKTGAEILKDWYLVQMDKNTIKQY